MLHGCVSSQLSGFYNENASFLSSANDDFDSEDEQEETGGTVAPDGIKDRSFHDRSGS